MKHLKIYEMFRNVGCYIAYIKYYDDKTELIKAKIIEVRRYDTFPYIIIHSNGRISKADDFFIKRNLTPEEIEEFEIEKKQFEYNL